MKKLILFFTGVAILLACGGMLFIAGAIFDAGEKMSVETYFFQPNNLSSGRPGVPATPEDLGQDRMIDMLIGKFVTEYFYAIPDEANITARLSGQTAMKYMSSDAVFNAWRNSEAEKIQQLVWTRSMRTVRLIGAPMKPMGSDYWTVEYELKTWQTPNDMTERPTITRGRMYISIMYNQGLREPVSFAHQYLESGGDPAVVFVFRVMAVAME